ncbi:hypothetical protein IWQ62_006285 [Dispira parvispora]|uniref:Mitochondrial cardiolipin hydrolase n=1 Tax=Dispira parvispora TaxID=1520584 RepID=A0A9W8AI34_9FUNG|nr:hypothetical protein IWQ62_006285 [Dispira parvispora]
MSLLNCLLGLFASPSPSLTPQEAQQLPLPNFVSRSIECAPSFVHDQASVQALCQIFHQHLAAGPCDVRRLTTDIFQVSQRHAATSADQDRLRWVQLLMDIVLTQGQVSGGGPSVPPPSGATNSYATVVGQQKPQHHGKHSTPATYPGMAATGPSAVIPSQPSSGVRVEPHFFPSERSFRVLVDTLQSSRATLDICVFNITDDDLANAIIASKKRQVQVRIIADDEQCSSQGSDVQRLHRDHRIPVRLDNDPSHMHNKFAIVDNHTVITGSYNWTKG